MPHHVHARGFRGLPLLMELAKSGFSGLRRAIERRLLLGESLRERLAAHGFEVVNRTPLPVVCFVDATNPSGKLARYLAHLAVVARKRAGAFVSLVRFPDGSPVLRATITSDKTSLEDLDALMSALDEGRSAGA